MNLLTEKEISENIFDLSEESVYTMIEKLKDHECIDKTLVYCFAKAFYLYTTKLYLESRKEKVNFDEIYTFYKENLKFYYQTNNPSMETELLEYVLDFFDHSFALIGTIEFTKVQDSYEFRHYVIRVFELLRIILENKSKSVVRENIFENDTKIIVEQCDKIFTYFDK